MPIHRRKDKNGPYFQYGESGAKYRYVANDKKGRELAEQRAHKHARAIHANTRVFENYAFD